MDRAGKVLSINKAEQSLFHQFARYDGCETESAIDGGLSEAFDYMARQLRVIFGNRDDTCIETRQPIVRIYSHLFWRDIAPTGLRQRFERKRRPFHGLN